MPFKTRLAALSVQNALLTRAALAACSSALAAPLTTVAVAACSFALAPPDAQGRYLLQLTPAQDFAPSDGRPMDVPAWRMNAAIASKLIGGFNTAQPPVIDYEHQTLHKEKNGQPAPAAGWIHGLRWIEGRGLFAEAELTKRARAEIDAGEYRYFSPVFLYAPDSGEVLQITMGALTNNPAIHGMQALNAMQAAASAQFSATTQAPEEPMNPLLKALLAALGLPETTTEQVALTAVTAQAAMVKAARDGLKLKAEDGVTAITAACSALATTTPDPSKYVPISVVEQVQQQLAVLTAQQQTDQIEKLIAPALADGRLNPVLEPWARDMGKANVAQLTAFLAAAQPIAALSGTQTQGQSPATSAKGAHGLSADELAVCSASGLSPEDFAKTKASA